VFLHDCANAIWSLKRWEGLHLSILVTFLRQNFLIILQRMQTSSILSRAVTVGLVNSWLPPLHLPSSRLTYCRPLVFQMEKYGWPITSGQFWTWRDFDIYFEPTWCPVISPFSFFLSFCTFS
jgi:hypothetical protein